MKLFAHSRSRRQQGVAVIVVLALLSIMLLYVLANSRSLYDLGCELRLLEKQQIKRLNARMGITNAPTAQLPAVGTNAVSVLGEFKPQQDPK